MKKSFKISEKWKASVYTVLILCFALTSNLKAFAQQSDRSVYYLFDSNTENGYFPSGVPTAIENGALKFTIDPVLNKAWKAKLKLTVNKDIFANPVMKIRCKVGTRKTLNAKMTVSLKIDNIYNESSEGANSRINAIIYQTTTEWQDVLVNLKPLIESWESTKGIVHGNIQEIELTFGINSDPFISEILYIDNIKMGDVLGVNKIEISSSAPNELIANTVVPVTGTPTTSNFTVTKDGVPLTVNDVFIRNGNYLILKLATPIDFPRDMAIQPVIKVVYNGNDAIIDASNSTLEAFQKNLLYTSYAESMWRYWGKYEGLVVTRSCKSRRHGKF